MTTDDSRIAGLLDQMWQHGATDLLLTADRVPQLRVHGDLQPAESRPLTVEDVATILTELLGEDGFAAFERQNEHDFAFTYADRARVRGNAFVQRNQPAVALRMVPRDIPEMENLGLPPVLHEFTKRHHGLVLVTGPTGSGKSTSLAAMIGRINAQRACHIITIEDPIEYVHDHGRATVSQREVGSDTASFPDALRAALREDPDVVLVGEMRDLESIRFAMTIAETGHLVFATLHTNDTAQALSRIVDVFPAEQQAQVRVQLAAALTGIVYQRLVPRIGGGLVAAYEVLVATSSVRNLIREGKTNQLRNALVTGQRDGMVTFEQSLSALVRAGVITPDDAIDRSLYPNALELPPPRVPVVAGVTR